MSRTRSVAGSAPGVHRRTLFAATGAVALSAGAGYALRPTDSEAVTGAAGAPDAGPAGDPSEAPAGASRRVPAASAPYTRGTTLAAVATARGSGYRRLGDGPGWARAVREDLASARTGRERRRTALAAFVQLTDLHLTDTQHPLRLEYLRAADVRAWRPQEALTVPGAVALVERINALRSGPVTGAPLHFAMTTGDNTDNNARSELEWFLTVMSGGRVTPDTGAAGRYEGVQNSGLKLYWQAGDSVRDADKQLGFPYVEGFLAAAVREVRSPGLNIPWYSTVGNHDALPLGTYASHGDSYLTDLAVGGKKLMSVPAAEAKKLQQSLKKDGDPRGAVFRDFLKSHARSVRSVTPDERRAPYTPREYVRAHLDPAVQGRGPVGHGYSTANLDAGTQYYSFRIADDVIGVSLDTTDPGGHYEGSLGAAQFAWLDRTLRENKDAYAVVFSHHTSRTMGNLRRDPARPGERRVGGAEVVALLARHRNVLAWVNGHIHKNVITPHSAAGGRAFWEISTASHVDFPQLARLIEVVDNKDGTVSLFTTLVESSAPYRASAADLSQTGLASLYRELSLNAPGARTGLAGKREDRNTELVLKKG
ncbi:hydrolase [Streptomyces zinciresistens K42]|uniref:Hydrolase n=1 Tax=Streptomyces zinciresistens K42 TaxID=700597 RepID=G2GB31_9ACTN|nr:TIGR03767 family metallophosphoesterase [Streptomyces zinciresistens]EGX59323.1 hydrolase [Streptomyces zinciresistens K42]